MSRDGIVGVEGEFGLSDVCVVKLHSMSMLSVAGTSNIEHARG